MIQSIYHFHSKEGINMNKIYKVIWSKAKHTYVVASEIAKGHTKGETTGRGLKKLAAALLVAAALMGPNFAWAADTVTVNDTSTVQQTVYTKDGADNTFVKKGSDNGNSLTIGASDSTKSFSHQYKTGAQTIYDGEKGQVVTQATGDKSSISLKVGNADDLNYNFQDYSEVTTTRDGGTTFTYHYKDGAQTIDDNNTTIKGNTVTTGRVTASNGVVDGTTTEGVSVKKTNTVGQNLSALDDRITAVKDYVLNETGKNYVSKTDAALQDGAIVKADKTIGENVTNLDAALAKETAARIGADKAQDAVIQQVNQNAANGIATLATAYNNEVASREAADTAINNKLAQDKTDTALHVTKDGNLIVGTKENQTVKDVKIRGQLTSGSVSTGNITATGDAKVAGKVEAEAVYDDTTKPGNYVVQTNSVGSNLSVLDTQVKANADAVATKANAADVYTKTETDSKVDAVKKEATTYTYRKVAAEEAARKAADNELNERITNEANAIHETTNQLQSDLSEEAKTRESKDNELNERITNEANAIHDEIKAGDTALDNRITAVKESLQQEAADTYVSKADAAVQDGAIVKADKTIGENVTNLDAALAKETADRLGADKAQDKVIQQVNQNMVDGFNSINKNMADGFTALNNADLKEAQERAAADTVLDDKITAETSARVVADTKLVEAVNSGLSLSNNNVLQKNTTTIDAQGNVTTSKTDANEMILNKGKDNQITLNEKGIKVGTNSSVMDKDGVYTGGDTYSEAKAALKSDGQIKGANGKFTVDASGNTTVTSLDAGTGTIQTKGDLYAKDATFSGDITAKDATLSGDLSAKDGTFSGDLSAKDGTFSGDVSAKDVTATGTLQGAEVTDGTATLKQGKLTGVKDIETEALHVNGDANVTGKLTTKDLEVTGEFNANTLKSRLDENNYTEIHGGNVTSKNLKVDKGVIRTSESSFDENGREEYVTDNDSRATVKVGANEISQTLDDKGDNPEKAASRVLSQNTNNKYEITDSVVEGNQSNVENRTADTTDSQISFKDDSGKVLNKSYITQNLKKVLMGVEEGDNKTTIEQDANNITNTAKNGTIKNDAGKLVNTASGTIANMAGNDITNTSTNGNIANTAANGTISNNAKNLTNTASENITNKAENGNISNIASNGTISNEAKTISNKATEALTNDAKTITNKASESVTTQIGDGSEVQSVMNGGGIANKATGKSITNDAATITNTGTTSVTNQVGNNKVLVDTTHVQSAFGDTIYTTWDESGITNNAADKTVATTAKDIKNTATGDISNIASNGTISNEAKTISNKATEALTNDAKTITNKASESVTTQIGDGSEVQSVMNGGGIANKATGKSITNDAATITNTGTTSVTNQVGNNKVLVDTTHVQSAFGDTIYTTWDESGITNNATDKTVATNAKNIQNTATGDITNTASTGTITNDAKTLLNKASDSIIDKVGANVERTMTTKKISESVKDGTKSNSFSKTAEKDINIITDGTTTSTLSQLANSVNTSLKNGTQSLNNTKTVTEDVTKVTDKNTGAFSSSSQKADAMTNTVKNGSKSNTVTETASTSEQKLVSGNIIDILKDAENGYVNTTVSNSDGSSSTGVKQTYTDITNTAKQGTITNEAKNLVNKAEEKLSNSAAEIENTATTSIKDTVGKSTVTTTTDGTTFENTDHNVAIGDGSIKKTTISGNTLETGKATMDYAEVMKDLRVGGTTTTEDLHVTNNATIDGTLDVTGAANFQNKVTVAKDLSVGGDVTADSYKVGDKTYIDKDGINANNQVIRNVGQGDISEGSTDAVSGGQLYETNTRVSGLETRMGTVETKVDKLDNKIDKVGANAAAMANLHPLEFDEDSKWNIAAAVGSSGSETASAVGVFYRPNENVMVNASAAMGTGENMFGGGVSLRLGHGGNKAKEAQMKAAAAENKELRAKVDDLTARMDALLSVLNPNMSKDFPDVPENHWAYEAVSRLAGNGIVEGYEDGKYHGERQMTRYEMAEIIYNALSKGAKAEKKLVEEFRPELQAMAAQKKA